jgi:hypothetical protein
LVTTTYGTPLRSVGLGTITGLTSTVITDGNASFPVPVPVPSTGALGLIGLEIDPNTQDSNLGTYTIIDNTATSITVDASDGDLSTVAAVGDTYIGVYKFDDMYVLNGARVETGDNVVVSGVINISGGGELKAERVDMTQATDRIFTNGVITTAEPLFDNVAALNIVDDVLEIKGPLGSNIGTLTLTNSMISTTGIDAGTIVLSNNSRLSHPAATLTAEYRLEITADTLTIDSTSAIDVSGKGYLGGYSGGNSSAYGRTLGNTTTGGSYRLSGGSYGGLGYKNGTDQVNSIYGDFANPNESGSGGGGYSSWGSVYPGGNGGGLVRIIAGSITLDGNIYANGGVSQYYSGGSGGGIYIGTDILTGSGAIRARGGSGSGAGGGGRIAVYYSDISGYNTANITAYGGDGTSGDGGAGTVYLKSTTQQ